MNKKELKKKIEEYSLHTNDIQELLIEYVNADIEKFAFTEDELLSLIKEACESIVPEVNDPDRPFDNRVGTIEEIKLNIKKLFE